MMGRIMTKLPQYSVVFNGEGQVLAVKTVTHSKKSEDFVKSMGSLWGSANCPEQAASRAKVSLTTKYQNAEKILLNEADYFSEFWMKLIK